MKSRILVATFVAFIALSVNGYTQNIGIDSEGESIFTFYPKGKSRFSLDINEMSFTNSFGNKSYRVEKVGARIRNATTTVQKFRGWFFKAAMLNADDYFLVKKLDDLRPGIGLKLGHQNSIDTFTNIDAIPKPYRGTFGFTWNGIFNVDNVKLFNTDISKTEKRYPLTAGAEATFNFFFKNTTADSIRVAISLNTKLVRTWNDDDLLNYKELSSATMNPPVIAFEKFDGRYGVLKNVTKFRASLSLPIYVWHLNPIPYGVVNVVSGSSPSYHVGLYTNILTEKLTKTRFTIPSSIGFGIDWVRKDGSFSKPNIFFSGSIDLD